MVKDIRRIDSSNKTSIITDLKTIIIIFDHDRSRNTKISMAEYVHQCLTKGDFGPCTVFQMKHSLLNSGNWVERQKQLLNPSY